MLKNICRFATAGAASAALVVGATAPALAYSDAAGVTTQHKAPGEEILSVPNVPGSTVAAFSLFGAGLGSGYETAGSASLDAKNLVPGQTYTVVFVAYGPQGVTVIYSHLTA